MKKKTMFDYDEVFMGVFQDRPRGFYKETYKEEPELRRIVEMVTPKKGRMLDIGSGGGLLTECLPFYYPNIRVYGCDISRSAIRYANTYGTGKVRYKVMKKRLPYPSNYFDVCICTDVLEHIPDVQYFLKDVRRILKKEGIFFLSIPCEGQPFTLHWFFRNIGFWGDLTFKHIGHIHPEFTHAYVTKLFQDQGYTILSKKYSERWIVQFLRFALYMIPKEMLEVVLGKRKAQQYSDRSVIVQKNKQRSPIVMGIRILWFKICKFLKILYDMDAECFTEVSVTAGKVFLLVQNDKK
jgi:2-polyprenyl-3-methyl-5-hydroxy-6-metoxy-1,4-benzoquinol methylase